MSIEETSIWASLFCVVFVDEADKMMYNKALSYICQTISTKEGMVLNFLTDEEKHKQMLKEIKWTFLLILLVAAWHIGFAFALDGIDKMVLGMPLWFFVSTIGAFAISVVGVMLLLKFVFVNFDLGEEAMEEEGGGDSDK